MSLPSGSEALFCTDEFGLIMSARGFEFEFGVSFLNCFTWLVLTFLFELFDCAADAFEFVVEIFKSLGLPHMFYVEFAFAGAECGGEFAVSRAFSATNSWVR